LMTPRLHTIIVVSMAASLVIIWSYVFREQHRRTVFGKSAIVFGIPIAVLLFLNYGLALVRTVPPIFFIALEEGLKVYASRLCKSSREAFSLVVLIGIWELLLTKGVLPWVTDPSLMTIVANNQLPYFVLILLPVFMHTVTAGIYSLWLSRSWVIPYFLSLTFHVVFNVTRDLYFDDGGNINSYLFIFDALAFSISCTVLWRIAAGQKSARAQGNAE
jgi:hypothetical protein